MENPLISVTDDEIDIWRRDEHPLKINSFNFFNGDISIFQSMMCISVTDSGIFKAVNDEHSSNASSPMILTESGISIW